MFKIKHVVFPRHSSQLLVRQDRDARLALVKPQF